MAEAQEGRTHKRIPLKANILLPRSFTAHRSPMDPAALHITPEHEQPARKRNTMRTAKLSVTPGKRWERKQSVSDSFSSWSSSSRPVLVHVHSGSVKMKKRNIETMSAGDTASVREVDGMLTR